MDPTQTVTILAVDPRFKIPVHAYTDPRCPTVDKVVIKNKECNAVSTEFKNAADVKPSLSDGFYYA